MIKKMILNVIRINESNFIILFIYNIEYIKYFLLYYYFITTITNIFTKNTFHQNKRTLMLEDCPLISQDPAFMFCCPE